MKAEFELNEVRNRLSLNIIKLRKAKGLAQERLGLDAGVDRTVVSKIERKIANPSLDILVRLARTLDVKVGDLFVAED